MIYGLGRRFAFIRKLYYKLTGKYKWGYIGYIEDYGYDKTITYQQNLSSEEFAEYTKTIFDYGVKKHKGCEYRMCPICGGASKDQIIIYIETSEGIIVDISLIEN